MIQKFIHSKLVVVLLCLTVLLLPMTTMARGYYYGPDIYVNGYYLYTDTSPIVVDGRILVPVRAVTEALGCQVDWYPQSQIVEVRDGYTIIDMTVGSYYADIYYDTGYEYDYDFVYMDAIAEVYNGRLMVPLRFIAETIGLQVQYDYYTGDIYITECCG